MSPEPQSPQSFSRELIDFAKAWQEFETPPEIADFLPQSGSAKSSADPTTRRRLLIELILVDLEYRWSRPISSAATIDESPPLAPPSEPTATIDYQSTSTPQALPNRPRLEHYVQRYPDLGPLAELPDELILCEFRLRKRHGDWPVVDQYREQFGPARTSLWATLAQVSAENETNHDLSLNDTRPLPSRRALKIRCPHCHNPVEILDEQGISGITCPSCDTVFSLAGREESKVASAATPRRFGHFELIEQVGEGAFGAVWKARDTQLDRIVAVKIPRRTQLDAEDIEQFIREARAAAQLKHPNIVSVHEVGRQQETVYIVSDFIEGQSLDKWLIDNRLKPKRAALLCRRIALALHHAHEAGIVHRDLKPSNIMIDAAGEPHVMDFGLAKREAGEITMTVEGQILGTPAYMSPEQAKGEGHKADRRSDIYSLGVILFELLTGERPFVGDLRMLLKQVIEDEAPSPRKLDARIPKDLETITLKCLEKDPAKRYSDAFVLVNELDRFVDGRPIVARPITRTERAWRWCKRNPVVAGLSAATAITLCAGIVATSLFALDARRQATETAKALAQLQPAYDRADDEAQRATAEAGRANSEEQKSSQRLYVSQIARAQQAWESGDRSIAWDQLLACRLNLRGWEHDYLFTLFSREKVLRGHKEQIYDVAYSPDGKRIASGSWDRMVKVWDATSGEETLTLKGHLSGVRSVAFSPDGKRIVSGSDDNTLKVWDATSGKETLTLKGHTSAVTSVALNPSGTQIVSGSIDHKVMVWDATTGAEIVTFKGHIDEVWSVAFSPDGIRIVSGSGDQTARVWDAASGLETLNLRHISGVWSVTFTPDGKRIVCSSGDGLKVWDATNGQESLKIPGGTGKVAISCDGKWIASPSNNRLKVWDATTGAETLSLNTYASGCVAFSPDGSRIVSGSGNVLKIWDATRNMESLTVKGIFGRACSVAFSPDGKRVVCGSLDNTLKVWDSKSGKETLTIKGHTHGVSCVAFSPDGNRIVSSSGDQKITVWDATCGAEILVLKGQAGGEVAFSPDGKHIVSGSGDQTIKVWDATTGKETLRIKGHTHGFSSMAYSPDGKRIVSAGAIFDDHGEIKIWDATSGGEIITIKGHTGRVATLAFSPDGNRIVSGSADNTLKVWNASSGEEIRTLKGHTNGVWCVAFSPDGKRIASGSGDQTVKVWDATTGEETLTIKGHTDVVRSAVFSPDGRRIATGADDETLKIWDATASHEVPRELSSTRKALKLVQIAGGESRIYFPHGSLSDRRIAPVDTIPPEECVVYDISLWCRRNVDDEFLAQLRDLLALDRLDLSGTNISESSLKHIARFHSLGHLHLQGLPLTGEGFAHLGELTNLKQLGLFGCNRIVPDNFRHLQSLEQLQELLLAHSSFNDEAADYVSSMKNLNHLDLAGTNVTDKTLVQVAKCSVLNNLSLNQTRISDAGLSCLISMKELAMLHLEDTRVSDPGLESVSKIGTLRFLKLDRTPVTDAGLSHLEQLRDLREVTLKGTQVTSEGVAKFRLAVPKCKVTSEFPQVDSKPITPDASAALTPDATGRIDFLQLVTLEPHVVSGKWRLEKGVLYTPTEQELGRLEIPYAPPAEYDLQLVVVRKRNARPEFFEPLAIGLVGGGKRFQVVFDHRGEMTVLEGADGEDRYAREAKRDYAGRVFPVDEPVTIRCEVRNDGLTVSKNGTLLFRWNGDYSKTIPIKDWETPNPKNLSIGTWHQPFEIRQMLVRPVGAVERPTEKSEAAKLLPAVGK